MKVVTLSVLRTGRLNSPGNVYGTHFCSGVSRPQCHSAAGRIMSMKNSNDTIGNRTRDLPACSAVPQPTASPRAPTLTFKGYKMRRKTAKIITINYSTENIATNLGFKRFISRHWCCTMGIKQTSVYGNIWFFFKIIIVVNFVYVSVTFISHIQRGVFTNGVLYRQPNQYTIIKYIFVPWFGNLLYFYISLIVSGIYSY